MPNVEKTPRQTIRIELADWDALGRAVGVRERGRLIRQLIAWYLRKPGAKLPQRPPAP